MNSIKAPPSIWQGQLLHLVSLITLLVSVWFVWASLDKPHPLAFWVAVSFPIAHQIFVWLAWRLELNFSLTSRTLGFHVYIVIFFLLFAGRFASLFLLASLDRDSFKISMFAQASITSVCSLLGLYAMYSVKRYFGMIRAAGADHFDSKYQSLPLVKQGIFRFTSNAMYIYAFLLFWAIAVGFSSITALVVAGFSHAYIWVLFYSTEKPDMDFIYGPVSDSA